MKIITHITDPAAVLNELARYHTFRRPVTLPAPLPETHVAAWSLARDVTPASGSGSAPNGVA